MWFADAEVRISLALAVAWLVIAVLVASDRHLRLRPRVPVLGWTGVAAVLLLGQSVVVDAVADADPLANADPSTLSWMVSHRTGVGTTLLTLVSDVGGTAGMAVLAAVGATLLWWQRHRRAAVVVVVAAVGATVLVVGCKHLYGRARPPLPVQLVAETSFSLPSGHALGSIVVLGVLAAVGVRVLRSGWLRATVVLVAGGAVVVIGVSRLYLGVHWLTDVLTGWLLGGAWLALCLAALHLTGLRPRGTATSTNRRHYEEKRLIRHPPAGRPPPGAAGSAPVGFSGMCGAPGGSAPGT